MTENEFNSSLNVEKWATKGFNVLNLQTFIHEGQLEGSLVKINLTEDNKEEQIAKCYKEIASIAFSEGYVVFLSNLAPVNSEDLVVILVPENNLTEAFMEMKVFDLYGVFDLHAPHLNGSLEKLQKIKENMIKGDIDKSLEFFDVLYDVAFIQDMIAEDINVNTAVRSLKIMTGLVVAFKSDKDKLSIGIDLEQSNVEDVLFKSPKSGSFAKLADAKNIQSLKKSFSQ